MRSSIEPREQYMIHFWKVIFIIPTIYNIHIKSHRASHLSTPSEGSENNDTNLTTKLKYRSQEQISVNEIKTVISQMETDICSEIQLRRIELIEMFLSGSFATAFRYFGNISTKDTEDTFRDYLKDIVIYPVLFLFEFVHKKPYVAKDFKINVQHLLGTTISNNIIAGIQIFKNNAENALSVVKTKQPHDSMSYDDDSILQNGGMAS